MSVLDVIASLDDLYRRAVEDPAGIDDRVSEEWLTEASWLLPAPIDREIARAMRRGVRMARRLASYWAAHDGTSLPDWRNGVDEALASKGWEPHLDLARRALELEPDPEAFEEVKRLHRTVHFTPWMEGVTFEEWTESD